MRSCVKYVNVLGHRAYNLSQYRTGYAVGAGWASDAIDKMDRI